MSQTAKRVARQQVRVGNTFNTTFAHNPNPNTESPHASFTQGSTLASQMVVHSTNALRAVANDIATGPSTSTLAPADVANTPTLPEATESPTLPEAGGTTAATSTPNWTTILLAMAIVFLVVKL